MGTGVPPIATVEKLYAAPCTICVSNEIENGGSPGKTGVDLLSGTDISMSSV